MPSLQGFSHVSLSVHDREVSQQWYCDVFGFELFEQLGTEAYRESVLMHPATGMVLCLQQHSANVQESFEPQRTGLDHVAFKVASREELDRWAARLAELGVVHSPVVDMPYGSVLCLRDPDQIQLEIFYRPGH